MHVGRRFFLSGSIAFAALAALPRALLAAAWPEKVFASTAAGEAMISLLGTDNSDGSDYIESAGNRRKRCGGAGYDQYQP